MQHSSFWQFPDASPALAHGGDLGPLRAAYPCAPEPWIDLSTGINPVPYPCPAIEASAWTRLPSAADDLALRRVAAESYGAPSPNHIVAAPGTQAIIALLPRLVAGTRVAVIGPTYAEHAAAWTGAGHTVREVGGIDAVGDARVAVLVDPNNPDGRSYERARIRALLERMRARDGLLVLDEAFMDLEPIDSLCAAAGPGLVVLRSFGKAYGLAGLRLGFAVGEPALAGRISAAVGPWAVAGPAIRIGRAALADRAWRDAAARDRAGDAERLERLIVRGGDAVGGTCLFRTADFPDGPAVQRRLAGAGIAVRAFAGNPRRLRFGLPGDEPAWRRLAEALT